ncbi:MAG: type II toxin-antitoxin system Phd/YefM family antitoxin [Acidimicrobiia bacterium]
MEEISHRQLRNDSAEVLRRAARGELLLITNNGQPAAVIGPHPPMR